ncbi:unnamed protein product [Arctogadus glacialis]
MGKDQALLQAVKTEDLLTAQRLLQRPRPGKASLCRSRCAVSKSSVLTAWSNSWSFPMSPTSSRRGPRSPSSLPVRTSLIHRYILPLPPASEPRH